MFLTFVPCFCLILTVIILWRYSITKIKNGLPGPTPLPILGNLLQIGFRPHITFTKWANCYGPIYKVKLGFKDAVVVNDYKLIKELFSETASAGRMTDNPVLMEFSKGPYGILNSSGSTWEAQRKFTMRTLHSLGFAKTSMETMILGEVKILLDWLEKQEGSSISGEKLFTAPVINSLWRIISGERCQWEKSRPAILDATNEFFKALMNVSTNGLLFAPVLRLVAPNLFGWNRFVKRINKMLEMFQKSIAQHEESFDSTDLRDFIDHNLLEIRKEINPKSNFHKDIGKANMLAVVIDLFVGGSETTSNTLAWALLYLVAHQKVQKCLQKEIDEVIGSVIPTLSDRANMPYCEAVLSEVLRITPVAPLGAPHAMTSNLDFHGYNIPKGATIFANIYAVHHDPKIWEDTETFRPERFLNEVKTKYVRREQFIPFSEGKRKCIGDTFAMDTMFLFVTSMFQNFNIRPDSEYNERINHNADFGFLLAPKPFKIVVSSRKS